MNKFVIELFIIDIWLMITQQADKPLIKYKQI